MKVLLHQTTLSKGTRKVIPRKTGRGFSFEATIMLFKVVIFSFEHKDRVDHDTSLENEKAKTFLSIISSPEGKPVYIVS